MRIFPLLFILLAVSGCLHQEKPEAVLTLEELQKAVFSRHLPGEVNSLLTTHANRIGKASEWHKLPDLARFVRNSPTEKAVELSRKLLWESLTACNIQFTARPERLASAICAGELRCRAAIALSKKAYLDTIEWKTPAEEQQLREVEEEIKQLFGGIPHYQLARVKLVSPGVPLPQAENIAVSEDPAEALQIAGAIMLMPDEIRRQELAGNKFNMPALLTEIQTLAGKYALSLSRKQLISAENAWKKDPSARNLMDYRIWYYRVELDFSRLPLAAPGGRERQFVNSMLLLQEGF